MSLKRSRKPPLREKKSPPTVCARREYEPPPHVCRSLLCDGKPLPNGKMICEQ